jgi:hypothetical protein
MREFEQQHEGEDTQTYEHNPSPSYLSESIVFFGI